MGHLTLELDAKVKTNQCEKCGFEYPRVHGFVYEDGDALAGYWAAIYVGHPDHPTPRVDLTIEALASEQRTLPGLAQALVLGQDPLLVPGSEPTLPRPLRDLGVGLHIRTRGAPRTPPPKA